MPKVAAAPVQSIWQPTPQPMKAGSATGKPASTVIAEAPAPASAPAATRSGTSAFDLYDASKPVPNTLPAMAVALANIGDEASEPKGPTYFAQMGAFSTLESAEAAWEEYRTNVPMNLPEGYAFANPVIRGDRTLYLLQAGPYSKDVGKRLCASMKSGCFAVRT